MEVVNSRIRFTLDASKFTAVRRPCFDFLRMRTFLKNHHNGIGNSSCPKSKQLGRETENGLIAFLARLKLKSTYQFRNPMLLLE